MYYTYLMNLTLVIKNFLWEKRSEGYIWYLGVWWNQGVLNQTKNQSKKKATSAVTGLNVKTVEWLRTYKKWAIQMEEMTDEKSWIMKKFGRDVQNIVTAC